MNSPRENLLRFAERASGIRVLVVGDCMLDAYIQGAASRISPEAPVPVVDVSRRRHLAGGAANVAANARALGASVFLAGVTGVDAAAIRLREELSRVGIHTDALVEDPSRVTTTKTRVTAAGQQIVRFDEEDRSPLLEPIADELTRRCEASLDAVDVCVLSDYAKGLATEPFCRRVIAEAAKRGVPVVVDPKARDLSRYRGARVIKPNMKEAAAAMETALETHEDLLRGVRLLQPRIAPSALLITRGHEGMSLFEDGEGERHLPALVNEVADVTGAGDTVAGALAVALGMGFSLMDAARIANVAAAAAVSHAGTWAVTADELLAMMERAPIC